ncbi:MAG TPA: tetratricopeptide repeat protein [Hyphomicrobium sp.]|nr:tetratricopeptide repeat protein [Hyphomicrobium sp.]
MADDGDSLLREVDEELRRERMEKLWQRYNGLIIGAAVLIIAGVAGYKFLETRRITAVHTAGAEFNAAVELANQNKTEDAVKAFEHIAQTAPRGFASLAKLHIAGAYVKDGKTAEAVAAYDALAADPSADQLLKSFARLQAASLRMGEADFTEMQNRLNSLTGDSSPYKVSARELLGFAAYKAGKLEEARKLLEPLLIDPNATRAIQDRIKIVMAEITAAEVAKESAGGAAPEAQQPAKPQAASPSPASQEAAPEVKSEAAPGGVAGTDGAAEPAKPAQ